MTINIYTNNNGVGLEADAKIIKSILQESHEVKIIDWNTKIRRFATLGIHIEHIRKEYLKDTSLNVLIPNPEWFNDQFTRYLRKIDVVLCKTWDSMEVFAPLHPDCRYIGFTSIDRFRDVEKSREFVHMAGKSSHKNTEIVFDAFTKRAYPLTLQKLERISRYNVDMPGYKFMGSRIDDIETFLSSFLFHLCPSKSEGFGHYINEALSVGGIVVTSDAAPMNELIKPEYGILIRATLTGRHNMGNEYSITSEDLQAAINQCLSLSDEQIEFMSKRAREVYLQGHSEFVNNLNTFMRCVIL